MLTRRAFVGGAVGLAAGAARGAPLPPDARLPGIVVATWDGCVLVLTESGTTAPAIRYRLPNATGVRAEAVSADGRTVAVVGPFRGRNGDPCPVVAFPLTGGPAPRPFMVPVQSVYAWARDGSAVVGSHLSSGFTLVGEGYFRNFRIDTATGGCVELVMPETRLSPDGLPVSPHRVLDLSADGRWYLTRCFGVGDQARPLHLVSADRPEHYRLDLDPVRTGVACLCPDGRRVLSVRRGDVRERPLGGAWGEERFLEVHPLTGGRAEEIGRWVVARGDLGAGVTCCWRADGRRVVVLAQRSSNEIGWHRRSPRPTGELVTMDPDGGNRRVVRSWVGAAPFGLLGWA